MSRLNSEFTLIVVKFRAPWCLPQQLYSWNILSIYHCRLAWYFCQNFVNPTIYMYWITQPCPKHIGQVVYLHFKASSEYYKDIKRERKSYNVCQLHVQTFPCFQNNFAMSCRFIRTDHKKRSSKGNLDSFFLLLSTEITDNLVIITSKDCRFCSCCAFLEIISSS